MAFTDPFIRRPVLATVISLLIVLLGFQAFKNLAVREFPEMENALITVTTAYPGANAETIQGYITQPLQNSLASAEGIDFMTSQSRQNVSVISVYARMGSDSDKLLTELLAKANEVKSSMPPAAQDPLLEKESDGHALMYLSFSSKEMSPQQTTDYIYRVVQPKLATLPGMAKAEVMGNMVFAMRIWLEPARLSAYGITANDVNTAIRQYNYLSTAGEIEGELVVTSLNAQTELNNAEDFANIPIKVSGDSRIRLGDIARVELGSESYDMVSSMNGVPSVYIGIKGTPSSNPLELIKHVRDQLPGIEAQLPESLHLDVAYDATKFIQASIDEVIGTLAEAVIIVIAVVFLFLGSFRSVLIPVITIPLSMIGVLFFMQLMGYSINLLTLLAMVLAIGLVVDDAIVVVENIHRHIDEGKTPFDAAIEGAREIAVPVISMTITLAAVYAPIGFLSGLTGALFKEFALTLAGSVIISGIVALTLSPMMCSQLLEPKSTGDGGLAHKLDQIFERLKQRYQRALHNSMETRPVVLVFALLILLLIPVLLTFTKKELAPSEDQSMIYLFSSSPQTNNLEYLNANTDEFIEIFKSIPEYSRTFLVNGSDGVHSSFGGFGLVPWNERSRSQMEVLPELQAKLNTIPGIKAFAINRPSLPGGGSGLPFQFVINAPASYESLLDVAERVKARVAASNKFAFVDTDLDFDKPELVIDIDREKAAQMGVSMQDIGQTLATLLGESEINRFTIEGRSYKVIAQAAPEARNSPNWIGNYSVRNAKGQMVSLATLVTVSERARPAQLSQFQQLNSVTIKGFPLVSMGEAIDSVMAIAKEESPKGFSFDYAGASRQFVQESGALATTFGLAMAVIYLLLAAQFESFRDPLVILVTVPLSICGALIPLFLGFATLNIYTQVGLVTLIGLISKHGILIVEFANHLRLEKGLSAREAVEEAAAIRLRPVLMTTAAMVFGMLPLLVASGAGAVSRFDIGLVIATGMSVGTLFTLFVLPSIYTLLSKRDIHSVATAS
ncbi:multidrug efflux pump [Pseudomonas pohangensis]|uniref:Multidrug efflux pump n=1 Tax=Pseudomonas pohangensis TaxID=364197 RepID=A0A1H2GXT3_9PSED|nr:multidrug efflux RND transporter permease subunit [Pseudomonas pohangensis]SDU24416.1 multidrug efflux pump [Pseudomonas pohangensis]